jgi:hypothetical protein
MGKRKLPPGTWIERDLYLSKAYFHLRGVASQVLTIFLSKRKFITHGSPGKEKRVCTNCDSIAFSYVEAKKKYGITQPRFTRAIDDLLEKGFITIKHQGGACQKDKTIYGLVDNWRLWIPGAVVERRVIENVKRGFQKAKMQN